MRIRRLAAALVPLAVLCPTLASAGDLWNRNGASVSIGDDQSRIASGRDGTALVGHAFVLDCPAFPFAGRGAIPADHPERPGTVPLRTAGCHGIGWGDRSGADSSLAFANDPASTLSEFRPSAEADGRPGTTPRAQRPKIAAVPEARTGSTSVPAQPAAVVQGAGAAYLVQTAYASALQEYDQAMRLDLSSPVGHGSHDSHDSHDSVYQKTGDADEAKGTFPLKLKLDPDNEQVSLIFTQKW